MKKRLLTLAILSSLTASKNCLSSERESQPRVAIAVPAVAVASPQKTLTNYPKIGIETSKSLSEIRDKITAEINRNINHTHAPNDEIRARIQTSTGILAINIIDGLQILQNDIAKCCSAKANAEKEALPAAPGGPQGNPAAAAAIG